MDPLSISTGIVGFVGFSLHTARRVKEFIDGIEGAPKAVKALSKDVCALYDVLREFSNTLNDPSLKETFAKSSLLVTLQGPLENCTNSLEDVKTTLKPFTKPTGDPKISKWRSVAWTFKEKEIDVMRGQLMAYKSSLDVALSVASLSATHEASQDIKRRIHGLQRHIDLDEDSVRHPTYVGSEAIGTDPGYALRKYLMETQTEMRTVNELGSSMESMSFASPRTSHTEPERLSRSPYGPAAPHDTNVLREVNDSFSKLLVDNMKQLPINSIQDSIKHIGNHSPYELPASPFQPSHLAYPQKHIISPSSSPQPFVELEASLLVPNTRAELHGVALDIKDQRSMMKPLSAWHLPQKRVFGLSLEQLYARDGCLVPILVHKCVRALRSHAIGMTKIYTHPSLERDSTSVVEELETRFNHDANYVVFDSPSDFGYCIGSVVAVLLGFLRQLPDPLLSQQHVDSYPVEGDFDASLIIRTVRKLSKCAQETLKDIILLLHDTWDVISQKTPAFAPEQLESLSSAFSKVFAGRVGPLSPHCIEALITKADAVFDYTDYGYLLEDVSSVYSFLGKYDEGYEAAWGSNTSSREEDRLLRDLIEVPKILVSSSITNVSDDLWALQSLSPPSRLV